MPPGNFLPIWEAIFPGSPHHEPSCPPHRRRPRLRAVRGARRTRRDNPAAGGRSAGAKRGDSRPPCSRADASGASRPCTSTSKASPMPCPAMPAARRRTLFTTTVSSGRTGHAESVKVTFDPRQVSYGKILQIYFSVAHDPTQLNRQGPDTGPQYRSEIFPQSEAQAESSRRTTSRSSMRPMSSSARS